MLALNRFDHFYRHVVRMMCLCLVSVLCIACSTNNPYQQTAYKNKTSLSRSDAQRRSVSVTTKRFNAADICSIFSANPDWYKSALLAKKRWNLPIHVAMAIIRQESRFRHDARPIRKVSGSYIPASSAYGYSQALKGTWKEYQQKTNRPQAKRDRFYDAIDFIGWYVHKTHSMVGIPKWRTHDLYLAYHDGIGGYQQGTHKRKRWLLKVAKRVANFGFRYHKQLQSCRTKLHRQVKQSKPVPVVANTTKTTQVASATSVTQRKTPTVHKRSISAKPSQNQAHTKKKLNGCKQWFGLWQACQ